MEQGTQELRQAEDFANKARKKKIICYSVVAVVVIIVVAVVWSSFS